MKKKTAISKQKYLVVSYDADEQLWFWDFVVSTSQEDAADLVCKRRPNVIAADAISPYDLLALGHHLETLPVVAVERDFRELIKNA